MSKGEDVQAYSRLLKFQKKRYSANFKDFLIVAFTLIFSISITLYLSQLTNNTTIPFSMIIFTINILFILFFLLAFIDYSTGFGLFSQNGIVFSSVIILFAIIISIILTIFSGQIFSSGHNSGLLSTINLANLLLISIVNAYYIMTTKPTRHGQEQMIARLKEIRSEVNKIPVIELGSQSSVDRAIKWIQYIQRKDEAQIWGTENPLYETSEVLRMFIEVGKKLNYSWTSIEGGKEEIHNLEQTYYQILDALDKISLEPTYEMLIPVLSIVEVDPSAISIDDEIYTDFKEGLSNYSEWDFVTEIEKLEDNLIRNQDIPNIFAFSLIFHQKEDYEWLQKCADIFANSFGILINRAATRFSVAEEREIPTYLIGLIYNTISKILKKPKYAKPVVNQNESASMSNSQLVSSNNEEGGLDQLSDEFSNLTENTFDLPSTSLGFSSEFTEEKKIKIGTSLAAMRNYIRNRQSIDGSWSGRIDSTAECLLAVSDQESAESDFIKAGIYYLLALQNKNGSWQDDIVLTTKVIRALDKINKSMNFGAF